MELYRVRELGPQEWGQWARAEPTREMTKALRMAEAELRYHAADDSNFAYSVAKADGIAGAIAIIEKLIKKNEMERE